MPTRDELRFQASVGRIAHALERIAERLPDVAAARDATPGWEKPLRTLTDEELLHVAREAEAWRVVAACASRPHSAADLAAVVYEQQVALGATEPGGAAHG
jgi:hypothetical protein